MSGTNPLPAGQWANIPPLAAGTLSPSNNGNQPGMAGTPLRPLRGPPASFTRQPYLGSPPAVSANAGFGLGGGAGIINQGSDADQSQGLVNILVGSNPSPNGSVSLTFPAGIVANQYVFLLDWATLVVGIAGSVATLTWTATRTLIPGERLFIAYQWTVSG